MGSQRKSVRNSSLKSRKSRISGRKTTAARGRGGGGFTTLRSVYNKFKAHNSVHPGDLTTQEKLLLDVVRHENLLDEYCETENGHRNCMAVETYLNDSGHRLSEHEAQLLQRLRRALYRRKSFLKPEPTTIAFPNGLAISGRFSPSDVRQLQATARNFRSP